MIRFTPDSVLDALLRPFALAAPDSWVYVEIIAPDLRFAALVLLALVAGLCAWRGRRPAVATGWLLLFMAVAFSVWTLTSGNGRYGILLLLLVGPLCMGLLWRLPGTRALRLSVAFGLVGLQGFAVVENNPWGWWGLAQWREQPFDIAVPADVRARPADYVTLSSISYSIVAPAFHPDSRWANLSTQRGWDDRSRAGVRTREFLAQARDLRLLFPSVWGGVQPEPSVTPEVHASVNRLLAAHALAVHDVAACRFLPSQALGQVRNQKRRVTDRDVVPPPSGFWLCPLARVGTPGAPAPAQVRERAGEQVFAVLEQACPRFFRPGSSGTLPIPAGVMRIYSDSDMKVYVLQDGTVMYKYLRSLNPHVLGTVTTVTAPGFRMDCDRIQGRSGLPWERDI